MAVRKIPISEYYYKKGEIDAFLNAKSNSDHVHGNIENDGKINSDISSANTNKIVVTDSTNKIKTVGILPADKVTHQDISGKVNVSDSESAQRFIDNITKDPSKKEYLTELYNLSEYRDTTISASSEEKLNKILKELTDKGYVLNE